MSLPDQGIRSDFLLQGAFCGMSAIGACALHVCLLLTGHRAVYFAAMRSTALDSRCAKAWSSEGSR